ncbi:hypothetical protein BpHYR1_025305 [Brachionus plicatilis]|uniref:Uncharacterized protein n=1 Tax=Brachionus plicatilis TaxID=10195 RepID=A0A3M7QI91_BRAPC|nr:hypothetical protein BpHYR1_025305 [Brachionus plicatilis]
MFDLKKFVSAVAKLDFLEPENLLLFVIIRIKIKALFKLNFFADLVTMEENLNFQVLIFEVYIISELSLTTKQIKTLDYL